MKDKEFLQWIYDRMHYVHGESEYVDYMLKLKCVIEATDPEQLTPNIMHTTKYGNFFEEKAV